MKLTRGRDDRDGLHIWICIGRNSSVSCRIAVEFSIHENVKGDEKRS